LKKKKKNKKKRKIEYKCLNFISINTSGNILKSLPINILECGEELKGHMKSYNVCKFVRFEKEEGKEEK